MDKYKSKQITLATMAIILALWCIFTLESCSTQKPLPQAPVKQEKPAAEQFQSQELNSPWKNESTQIIIDAYNLNSINWGKMKSDKRVVGVIHKASEGLSVDRKYSERSKTARDNGYLWGAYHLGTRDSVEKQADLFLSLVDDKTFLALDLEDTTSSRFMSLSQSIQFIEYVYKKTGKIVAIYANHSTVKLLNQKYPNHELLKKTLLWYARFKSNVTDFPAGVWSGYFMWQFSSEINCSKTGSCLYNVPGTKYDMDVNIFPGTLSELKAIWYNQ